MKQPTKAQLRLTVDYFHTSLTSLLEELNEGGVTTKSLVEYIERVIREVPYLGHGIDDVEADKQMACIVAALPSNQTHDKYEGKLDHQVRGWNPNE